MRHPRYFCLSIAAAMTAVCSAPAAAQSPGAKEVVDKARETNPNIKVEWNRATGLPRRISNIATVVPPSPAAAITASEPSDDEIKDVVKSWYSAPGLGAAVDPNGVSDVEVESVSTIKDKQAKYIATVEQHFNGIPVFASRSKVIVGNTTAGLQVIEAEQGFSPLDMTTTTASLSTQDAIAKAREAFTKELTTMPDAEEAKKEVDGAAPEAALTYLDPRLVGIRDANAKAALAWQVHLSSFKYFIDANSGAVLHAYRDLPHAMVRLIVDLKGTMSLPGTMLIDEANGVNTADLPADAKAAFDNLEKVYRYFSDTFKRDSFDNSVRDETQGGGALVAYVRYGRPGTNATWCPPKSGCLRPDAIMFAKGWTGAVDIVAHEFTHGIIIKEHGPLYSNEPGAVNEAFADIFGMLVENDGGSGNWLIGESAPGQSQSKPLRDMANPNMGAFDRQRPLNLTTNYGSPDHYDDFVQPTDKFCSIMRDNGCVHFNSGIINKLAHFIAQGGTRGDVTVTGIGLDKLARIAYRVLTVKLIESSIMTDVAAGFRDECRELVEQDATFTETDCKQVDKATQAVGLLAAS